MGSVPRGRPDGSPPARHIPRRRARPGFPEFGRHAGGYAGRLDRRWRRLRGVAGTSAPRACRRAQDSEGSGDARRARQCGGSGERPSRVVQGFVRERKGRALTSKDLHELEPLNRLLERDEGFGRIVARDRRKRRRSGTADDAPVAIPGSVASADRGSIGETCVRGGLLTRESVRRPGLHADVRRSYARPRTQMVQHGDLRQPRETGGASPSAQGTAVATLAGLMGDEIAAGDELDDLIRCRLCLHPYAGGLALPQDMDAIADLEDMMEVVADQDDGKAFSPSGP